MPADGFAAACSPPNGDFGTSRLKEQLTWRLHQAYLLNHPPGGDTAVSCYPISVSITRKAGKPHCVALTRPTNSWNAGIRQLRFMHSSMKRLRLIQ